MKIVFEGKKDKEQKKDVKTKLLEPEPAVYDKPYTGRADVSVGVKQKPQPQQPFPDVPKPPVQQQEQQAEDVLRADIESFKNDYISVFGIDSIVASSKDVLMLNLLFAIYSQLKELNDKFSEE